VVTCSARKRRYRDVLRQGAPAGEREARVRFVFLDVDEDVLRERARERKGHCAGEGLIGSQMDALERPGHGEEGDVVVVRVSRGMEVEETVGEVERRVREAMARGS
jgi:gluconokinase